MSCSLAWTELTHATGQTPCARSGHTITAHCSEKFQYVLFGGIAGSRKNDVYTLTDNTDGRWTWRAPQCRGNRPSPRCYHVAWSACIPVTSPGGSIEVRPHLFVYGGQDDERQSTGDVYILDLLSFSWRRFYIAAPVPPARELASAAWCNSAAWIFGGRAASTEEKHADVWRLDCAASRWNEGIDVGGASWEPVLPARGVASKVADAGLGYVGPSTLPAATSKPRAQSRPSSASRVSQVSAGSGRAQGSRPCSAVQARPRSAAAGSRKSSVTACRQAMCPMNEGLERGASIKAQWPTGRHSAPFVMLGDAQLYLFGGLTGTRDPQRGGIEVSSNELWCLDTSKREWALLHTQGHQPEARYAHSFWAVSPRELALWGGLLDAHTCAPPVIYVLDLQHNYWSTPFVEGTPFPPRASFACSGFHNQASVFFGGAPVEPLMGYAFAQDQKRKAGLHTESRNGVWLMHSTSRTIRAALSVQDTGVTMNMGPDRALLDTETLLRNARGEVLALQKKLQDVQEESDKVEDDILQQKSAREMHQQESRSVSETCQQLASALASERAMSENMMKQVQVERRCRQRSAELLRCFQNAVAACEALLLERDTGHAPTTEDPATQRTHREHLLQLQRQLDSSRYEAAKDQHTLERLAAEHRAASEDVGQTRPPQSLTWSVTPSGV